MTFDARTIWAAARTWMDRMMQERIAQGAVYPRGQLPLSVCIYPRDRDGCYLVSRGKLYWDEDTTDGTFQNTDDDLPEAEDISHVVGTCRGITQSIDRYWPTWAAFAADVGLPK